jgi:hypothetical protein
MKPLPLPCAEKSELITAYKEATQRYSDAVAKLNQNMGICAKDRYDLFYRLAHEARQLADKARERLDNHVAKHAC